MSRSFLYGVLAAGDLAVFLAFPALGVRSHEEPLLGMTLLRNTVPFAAAWFIAAPLLGAFRARALGSPKGAGLAVLLAWPAAGLAGLVLRSWLFTRPWAWSFAIVALVVQGALLFAWRLAFAAFLGRRAAAKVDQR